MPPRTFTALLLVGLGALVLAASAAGPVPDKLQELVDRSPFENTTNNPASTSDHQPLEFRGVMEERGRQVFSIYDTVTRRSSWIDLNTLTNGIKIEAYDDAQKSIAVRRDGISLVLPLVGAKGVPMEEPETPETAHVNNTYHDKPFRIGHVHEETLIRRAVRRPAMAAPAPRAAPITH